MPIAVFITEFIAIFNVGLPHDGNSLNFRKKRNPRFALFTLKIEA